MDNDSDFTFCKVGPPVEPDGLETRELAADINNISIKDGLSTFGASASGQNGGLLWKSNVPNTTVSQKQDKVGSLTFNVIDASSPKQASQPSKQRVSGDVGKIKKPAARAKVPFEKGYSQVDWLRLTQTHPDLAGTYKTTFDAKVLSCFSTSLPIALLVCIPLTNHGSFIVFHKGTTIDSAV
uniref:Uncharacterized protein n=1 Tax=Cannabis sativa TaxID=3483 RepID=A0A803QWU7_CANSA